MSKRTNFDKHSIDSLIIDWLNILCDFMGFVHFMLVMSIVGAISHQAVGCCDEKVVVNWFCMKIF